MELFNPEIKGRLHMDEKCLKVGGEQNYDLNVKDSNTKYIHAHKFVEKRTKYAVVAFLREIKDVSYTQILKRYRREKHKPTKKRRLIVFVSDKFENYRNAFNKLFYRVAKLTFGVPISSKRYGLKHNNNPIERYNEDINQRYKIMRGFKSFESASAFLELRRIIYNFVNPHMELNGLTPAQAAGFSVNLGENKLLSLIKWCYLTKT